MLTASFAKATFERAFKAFASTLLAFLPASGLGAVPALNWGDMLTLAGYAALGSVLLSVVSAPIGGTGPSLANEAIVPPAVDPADKGATATELCLAVIALSVAVLALVAVFGRP